MRRKLFYIIIVLFVTACDNISCPLNNTVECKYTFCDEDGTAISIADTLTVTAIGTDSVIINRLVNGSSMSLPVSFYAPADTIILTFTDTLSRQATDTIWMEKTSTPHFDDPSCPIHMWHTISAVSSTHSLIDSIVILNTAINYDGLENIQIRFITD
ncbi:MAG: hypothetical protein K6F94_02370 [Bacteroidaceae bacterium]|nr:hypothetical protein [Bacteroidaceae bacterium]